MFRAIVLMAIAKHLVDAWLLLAAPRSIYSLGTGTILAVAFGQSLLAGMALVATALLAILALRRNNTTWTRRLLLVPQQFWLTVAAGGALVAIIIGQYPDGYVPAGGSLFILGDQIPRLLFATLHGIILVRAS